jgi:ATP-binding cassette subfamily B protein
LKSPKILILDDSTSAVDMKTDKKIRVAFKNYIPEITKIIIAQRISSIEDADKIIVLDNGKISGIGTHNELLESCSIYSEIHEQQTNGGNDDETDE